MSKQIFVNLPVRDLPKSMAFYTAIGFTNNAQFTDDTAACMVLSDTIYVMLLTHAKWATFTQKPIVNAHESAEVAMALTCESRAAVDAFVEAGAAHGGKADPNPPQDLGFMYQRSLEDLDGHSWEPLYMDMSQVPQHV